MKKEEIFKKLEQLIPIMEEEDGILLIKRDGGISMTLKMYGSEGRQEI